MSLSTRTPRTYLPKIFWGIILLALAFFFGKTALWENDYYARMEGSERAVATSSRPVEEEVLNWAANLPANYPAYITIDRLGVVGRQIVPLGIKENGELDTPANLYQVGWYTGSSVPGGGGTLVLDGHNGGPRAFGVLKNMPDMVPGDKIYIENASGEHFTYEVYENKLVPLSEANEYMRIAFSSPVAGKESLSIITCAGEWSEVQYTFLSRQFLRAVRVE